MPYRFRTRSTPQFCRQSNAVIPKPHAQRCMRIWRRRFAAIRGQPGETIHGERKRPILRKPDTRRRGEPNDWQQNRAAGPNDRQPFGGHACGACLRRSLIIVNTLPWRHSSPVAVAGVESVARPLCVRTSNGILIKTQVILAMKFGGKDPAPTFDWSGWNLAHIRASWSRQAARTPVTHFKLRACRRS